MNVGFEVMSQRDIGEGCFLTSRNGAFTAVIQRDGNFCLYRQGQCYWASQTSGKGQAPFRLSVQADGNVVIYDRANHPTWASNTNGKGFGPYFLVMQDDANLVLYAGDRRTATWATNTASAAPPPPSSELFAGQELQTGASLVSRNQQFYVTMQGDGNLVGYHGSTPFWASQTQGKGMAPFRLVLQQDGNAVVYDRNNTPTWATGTNGRNAGPIRFVMQDDRNICLYDSQRCIWASNTVGAAAPPPPPAELSEGGELRNDGVLVSKNGRYRLVQQGDGNLVGYQGGSPFWASNSNGKGQGPYRLALQTDHNLVIYDRNNHPTWASNTNGKGHGRVRLVMQDDRNVVIYDAHNHPIWASNTNV